MLTKATRAVGKAVYEVAPDHAVEASMAMSGVPMGGKQPAIPLPEHHPAALRAAVAQLKPAALAKFDANWDEAIARARDEHSPLPQRYFVEYWWSWVAVGRWPELAARLHARERIVVESEDQQVRQAAAAEIGHILRQAETATA